MSASTRRAFDCVAALRPREAREADWGGAAARLVLGRPAPHNDGGDGGGDGSVDVNYY